MMLEKAKNDIEFFNSIRDNLNDIEYFDEEEKRVLSLCIKIMDVAYDYNKSEDIQSLLNENKIREVDKMLCDIIENAKQEKQQLITEGELKKALDVAKEMLLENLPMSLILKVTKLSKEQIEEIEL